MARFCLAVRRTLIKPPRQPGFNKVPSSSGPRFGSKRPVPFDGPRVPPDVTQVMGYERRPRERFPKPDWWVPEREAEWRCVLRPNEGA
jgi:hypothetical protein